MKRTRKLTVRSAVARPTPSTPDRVPVTIDVSITTSAMQQVAHDSTDDIRRALDVVTFKQASLEQEITQLQAKLADAKSRLRANEAVIHGYHRVIAKR